jgi:hypothetical protein
MRKIALAGLGIATAALAFAVRASADVPAAMLGSWAAADGQYSVVINPNGHGHFVYADYAHCSTDCSAAGAPRTTVDFTLVSSSGNTASGADDSGEVVTAKINDQLLSLTVDGMPTFVFPSHDGVMH